MEGLYDRLARKGKKVKVLDGDEIRKGIHRHMGFSPDDIKKNNLLVAQLCKSLKNEYDYILVALISPFLESRKKARVLIGNGFVEIYIKASMDTLIRRDVKGLYRRALSSQIDNFIGISPCVPYEPPQTPEIIKVVVTTAFDGIPIRIAAGSLLPMA